nr:phage late control D family protein [Pseudoduganella buxea]
MQQVGYRDVIALSLSAHIEPSILIGKPAQLLASLADGTRASFRGYISAVAVLGSDGGFARYRLRLSPWLWQLGEVRNSRAWENSNVREIIDSVFASYLPLARWRWSDDVDAFLTNAGSRDYCCQYRESDLDFVTRLLTEEGLGWYFEDVEEDHCMVLFSDSVDRAAIAEDTSSASKGGIRFHAARSSEESDAIQAISNTRRLIPSESAMLSYDYKSKKIVKASVATTQSSRKSLPMLEHYEAPGHYSFAHAGHAEHYATLHAEASRLPAPLGPCARRYARCARVSDSLWSIAPWRAVPTALPTWPYGFSVSALIICRPTPGMQSPRSWARSRNYWKSCCLMTSRNSLMPS